MPDETTACKFRHLLEERQLGEQILGQVNLHLQAKGVRITTGTIVGATNHRRSLRRACKSTAL
jgi:transposase, IS5 family